jgi:hypothetical protein
MLSNNQAKTKKVKKMTKMTKSTKSNNKINEKNNNIKTPKMLLTKLRIGTIRKGRDGKLWKVDKFQSGDNKGKKKWSRASRSDVMCSNYLKKSIRQNIETYKRGNNRIKSNKQAIAIAYSMAQKKFPKCTIFTRRK